MITPAQIVPLCSELCPGFKDAWDAHLASWGWGDPGVYLDAGEFARYIDHCRKQHDVSALYAAFELVERLLRDGFRYAGDRDNRNFRRRPQQGRGRGAIL
jgi:hypothetical protein